jgi:predicted amino acid-binding ACT domain protein
MRQFATITVIGRDKIGVRTRFTAFLLWPKAPSKALAGQVTHGQFRQTLPASWPASDCHADDSDSPSG